MPAFAWVLIGLLTAALFAVWWWKPGPPEKEMHFSAALPFAARDLRLLQMGTPSRLSAIANPREKIRFGYMSWARRMPGRCLIQREQVFPFGQRMGSL